MNMLKKEKLNDQLGIAQSGRASGLEPEGRRFESYYRELECLKSQTFTNKKGN